MNEPKSRMGQLLQKRLGVTDNFRQPPAVVPTTKKALPPARTHDSSARDKIIRLYHQIQDSGLYIAPELDLQFGNTESIKLNNNGSERVVLADENYNANVLFTTLSCVKPVKTPAMISFGPPGAGKTTCAEYIGSAMFNLGLDQIHNATIYGHPEQTEEKMVARLRTGPLIKEGREEVDWREFITSPIRIVDEVNRLPPAKLSILYQIVDRGMTKYGSEVHKVSEGPLFATANAPDSGNFPLPLPFRDRFDIGVIATELNPQYIQRLGANQQMPDLGITLDTILTASEEIRNIPIDIDAINKLAHFVSEINYCDKAGTTLESKTKSHALSKKPADGLCTDCHYREKSCAFTNEPISPRAFMSIQGYSKAVAWFRGQSQVTDETLAAVLPYALWHKLEITPKAIEQDPRFENDRIGFIRFLFGETNKNFIQLSNSIQNYDDMMRAISASYGRGDTASKKDIKKHIRSLKAIDSVNKFSLAVALKSAYVRAKC